jgi:hypothetical protein
VSGSPIKARSNFDVAKPNQDLIPRDGATANPSGFLSSRVRFRSFALRFLWKMTTSSGRVAIVSDEFRRFLRPRRTVRWPVKRHDDGFLISNERANAMTELDSRNAERVALTS